MQRQRIFFRWFVVLLWLVGSAGCSSNGQNSSRSVGDSLAEMDRTKKGFEASSQTVTAAADSTSDSAETSSTGTFKVRFESTAGDFVVEVHRDWAPQGAERFYQLVKSGFYDECRFFRVVPGFMVQFGINGDPGTNMKWKREIPDDPVLKSNTKGFVTFATSGPNSRTTQIFINYGNNAQLDGQDFSPFGQVVEGMHNVEGIFSGYGESPDQGQITQVGNSYLERAFPDLDYVRKAILIEETP